MGQIQYSEKYFDDTYEYRHVVLPPEVAKLLPKYRLLSEVAFKISKYIGVKSCSCWLDWLMGKRGVFPLWFSSQNEWRAIGVQQSRGWVHYAIHRPEPHIMLFRRPLNYQQQEAAAAAQMLPK
ncbi:hypothetical protein ABZP36_004661 [Zizania latifolia]